MRFPVLAVSTLGLVFAFAACSSAPKDVDVNPLPASTDAGTSVARDAGDAGDGGFALGDEEEGEIEVPSSTTRSFCSGFTSCFLRTSNECSLTPGCTMERETCEGYVSSCYAQFDSYSCTGLRGCYWSASSKSCEGSATPCSLISATSCTSQRGCSLDEARCSGEPTKDCDDLTSATSCDAIPGCHWRTY